MGVQLRVRKDKTRYYLIDFRDREGNRIREFGGASLTKARGLLEQRRSEVRLGTYVNPKKRPDDTFDAFCDRFLREYATRCRSDHYKDRLPRIRRSFGLTPLREIRRADLDRFHAERLAEVGPSTVRKDLAVLVTLFRVAVEWGAIDASPAVKLRKPAQPKPDRRYLSPDEWQRLDAAAPPWLRPVLTFAVATGMRLKEITGLRWESVDRKAGVAHVEEDTKTGARPVPLGESALAVLRGQVRHVQAPYVFVDAQGQHYHSDRRREQVSRATSGLMRRLGIEGASFKTMRATAGSWMAQAGVGLHQIQKVLGHSSPLITEAFYAHLQPKQLQAAVGALDAALGRMDTYTDTWASGSTAGDVAARG